MVVQGFLRVNGVWRLKNGAGMAVNDGMRAVKYLLALWIAVAVYSTVSLFAGAKGISAYNDLLGEQNKQEANMETLERINGDLENTQNALLYDRDTIRVYARDLGFGGHDEKFVRIVGLGMKGKAPVLPGEIVMAEAPRFMKNTIIQLIAIFAALAVFIAFFVSDVLDLKLDAGYQAPETNE
jgi:cell division protein FtsB